MTTNYRTLLHQELRTRCGKNPAYSARAFARDLGISPAFLSRVMNGEKRLTEERASQMVRQLSWDRRTTKIFTTSVRLERATEAWVRETLEKEIKALSKQSPKVRVLSKDIFKFVSEWYHVAILELSELSLFRSEESWIAKRLGISGELVKEAVDRLIRLHLLKRVSHRISKTYQDGAIEEIPSRAIRKFHVQMIRKAMRAVEEQPPSVRDYSSITMAIDPKKLPEAKERLRNFRRELMEFLQDGDRQELYQLSIQLFRLDVDACSGGAQPK